MGTPTSRATRLGSEAIIWTDLPATKFRRQLRCNLHYQKIEIELVSDQAGLIKSTKQLLTRNQRAYGRLSWEQRLKRNQLKPSAYSRSFGFSADFGEALSEW